MIKKYKYSLYLMATDFAISFLAWILYFYFRVSIVKNIQVTHYFSLFDSGIAISIFWIFTYSIWGLYRKPFERSRLKEILNIVSAVLLGLMLLIILIVIDDKDSLETIELIKKAFNYFIIHCILAVSAKSIHLTIYKNLILSKKISFNTLLIGSSSNAKDILTEIETNSPFLGMNFKGFVYINENNNAEEDFEIPCLGKHTEIDKITDEYKIEKVVIAVEPSEHKIIEVILNELEGKRITINIIPDIYQLLLGAFKIHHILGTPLIEIKTDLMPVWQEFSKRLFDVVVSILVLIILSPFYLLVAILTKMSSPGPIIFSQERVGQFGIPFKIYKFRSMYIDAESKGPSLSSDNDPRITKWGRIMRKTRIDEFPQFYNVLKGDMSLVGPRPERQFYINEIIKVAPHYKYLNRVRPGITSLGQVKFGYAENIPQMLRRLKYDIIYIENMSIGMDLRIIFYTIITIIKGKGK